MSNFYNNASSGRDVDAEQRSQIYLLFEIESGPVGEVDVALIDEGGGAEEVEVVVGGPPLDVEHAAVKSL